MMKDIIKIGIVEDSEKDLRMLTRALDQYSRAYGCLFEIRNFHSIESFLVPGRENFDIIFFDIELPGKNGMEGAKLLRKTDEEVTIVFVTNLASFAIEGYQVKAYDYILKPIVYDRFAIKLTRVLNDLAKKEKKYVLAKGLDGTTKIDISTILYVEVMVHTLSYHLTDGKKIEVTGKLSTLEEELSAYGFSRTSRSFLINMKAVASLKGNTVTLVNGEKFELSRNRSNEFKDHFMSFISGGSAAI